LKLKAPWATRVPVECFVINLDGVDGVGADDEVMEEEEAEFEFDGGDDGPLLEVSVLPKK